MIKSLSCISRSAQTLFTLIYTPKKKKTDGTTHGRGTQGLGELRRAEELGGKVQCVAPLGLLAKAT